MPRVPLLPFLETEYAWECRTAAQSSLGLSLWCFSTFQVMVFMDSKGTFRSGDGHNVEYVGISGDLHSLLATTRRYTTLLP